MIRSFKSKALKRLHLKGDARGIDTNMTERVLMVLDQLEAATKPEDMNIPGNRFHGLQGNPKRYAVQITGNWRLTFEWEGNDATHVHLEDYH